MCYLAIFAYADRAVYGFLGNLYALVLFAINVNQVKVVKVTVFGATPVSTTANNNIFAYSIY